MKKIYNKPSLAIESFVTESVMDDNKLNALESHPYTDTHTWNFLTPNSGNVLQSIDYDDFVI